MKYWHCWCGACKCACVISDRAFSLFIVAFNTLAITISIAKLFLEILAFESIEKFEKRILIGI